MTPATLDSRKRWIALLVICMGTLMIVLDATIVNVALPSISEDLKFKQESLAWVANAYLITFGGFLLLAGRLGDLFGAKRLFVIGIAFFTVASLGCGLADSQNLLIAARAVQGLGGAVASAVGFALVMTLFTEDGERAKAMGVMGFVASGGGSLGVVLGGLLTDHLSWHWIFLVNLPIGAAVVALAIPLVPGGAGLATERRVDFAGAATITLALMLAVYAIVKGNEVGWLTVRTLGLLGAAAAILVGFLVIETKERAPLMPLGVFRHRALSTANVCGILWAGAMFAWFFLAAQYLQYVLDYSAQDVGLAFLPGNLIMGAFSIGISAMLVMKFGIRLPFAVGLGLATISLVLLARAPVDGSFVVDILPSMILLGVGAGMAFNPLLLAAMGDVEPQQAGLASGLVNTSFMMGGALGLAVLASVAAARTDALGGVAFEDGVSHAEKVALTGGYHLAFIVGVAFALGAVVLGALLLPAKAAPGAMHGHGDVGGELATADAD